MQKNIKLQIWAVVAIVLIWTLAHIPGLIYGIKNLPLHASPIGDEQAPINGAFHILQEKSLLGLRNKATAYYGPLFSVIAIPAVLFDAGLKYVKGEVHNALEYKQSLLFDWGMIAFAARCISVMFSLVLLIALYYFLKPQGSKGLSFITLSALLLISFNYYFFEYSHFFKHWIFMIFALSLEWLSLKYILEGRGKKWWIIHWGAVTFGVGISFFSGMSLIMWLPVLVRWIRTKNFDSLKNFARLTYSIIISTILIIWWHPSTFLRYLGTAGVEGVDYHGTAGVQSIFDFSQTSLPYYSTLILLNLLPLLLAIALFFWAGHKEKIYKRIEVWIILLPGIVNFLFFLPPAHHEGRYMLPTILSLLLLGAFLWVHYRSALRTQLLRVSVYSLLMFYLIFNTAHIVGWIIAYAQGPLEQKMVAHVLEKSQEGKTNILLIQHYIAGYPHTKEAYVRYARDYNKERFNLYQEILSSPLPTDIPLLNATYMTEKAYRENSKIIEKYDQAVLLEIPRKELREINQFDYIDENITRIWRYHDLMSTYTYLK
ncbi:MAG: hypothetical protein V4697_01185 [Patescibacteria group bacterium]